MPQHDSKKTVGEAAFLSYVYLLWILLKTPFFFIHLKAGKERKRTSIYCSSLPKHLKHLSLGQIKYSLQFNLCPPQKRQGPRCSFSGVGSGAILKSSHSTTRYWSPSTSWLLLIPFHHGSLSQYSILQI